MTVIGSYQLFELPLTLLSESYGFGAKNAGLTLITYLNFMGFRTGDLGLGSAVGWGLRLWLTALPMNLVWAAYATLVSSVTTRLARSSAATNRAPDGAAMPSTLPESAPARRRASPPSRGADGAQRVCVGSFRPRAASSRAAARGDHRSVVARGYWPNAVRAVTPALTRSGGPGSARLRALFREHYLRIAPIAQRAQPERVARLVARGAAVRRAMHGRVARRAGARRDRHRPGGLGAPRFLPAPGRVLVDVEVLTARRRDVCRRRQRHPEGDA